MSDLISFAPQHTHPTISLHIEDCRNVLKSQQERGILYDAIITDPPYQIGLHALKWDKTGISFSAELWDLLYGVLKPGGMVAAFAAPRLYHRMATAAEDAGFQLYPFLTWKFDGGLPKPCNVSELFDRDNIPDREIIGYRSGSGFTRANVVHGAQQRTHLRFPIYARYVSPEAQEWRGWYYGLNALKPATEPIMLAQKPLEGRTIDNVRAYRTGAMNIDGLSQRQHEGWATTVLACPKARKADHQSDHASVKPVKLVEDLCVLLCAPGGKILDPFAGSGTTGVAAQNLGYDCTLIEMDANMTAVIEKRLGRSPTEAFG